MKTTVSVRVCPGLWDKVKDSCKEHRFTITQFVADALTVHMNTLKPAKRRRAKP